MARTQNKRKLKLKLHRDYRVVVDSSFVNNYIEEAENKAAKDNENSMGGSTSQDNGSITVNPSSGPSSEDDSPIFVREYPCKVSASHKKEVKALKTELAAVKSENHDLKIQIQTLKDVIQSIVSPQQPAYFENHLPIDGSWVAQELEKMAAEASAYVGE